MLFRDVLVDGARVDVRSDGVIREVGTLSPRPGEGIVEGGMLTPPLAEPHVHLDAVLLAARTPNRSGTLREGIANWAAIRPTLTAKDVRDRARTVLGWYRSWGCLRVRTHADTGSLIAVQALLDLRAEFDLQVVAFPQEGILRAPGRREAWLEAVKMGCDAVGAIPHFERTTEEGWASVKLAFEVAARHDRRIDFHCDETDDPASRNLEVVCAQALDRGMGDRVVAGHCTALHSYENPHAAKVIELVAESGVQVVANPLDNIVLQGRYDHYPRRRGITRVDQLWERGARVGIGHDSVMDPWYPLGQANPVDAAYMLVHGAQLTSEEQMRRAFRTLHSENHRPFGDVPIVEPGLRSYCWWPGDEIEVLRTRPRPRVWREGVELSS